ncbi:nuclear transport factor 2 family protein [Steroidobacter sp. S1-65]|uniref:Nuclear transport factor 2 family protein n=2 Tax=Steroidobacter gossypii TaxID=2805490 RepID=A0ABS1X4A9_9GAMM|nr:nuclear transport factor 2 family protein [Steroidobacter gossypii]
MHSCTRFPTRLLLAFCLLPALGAPPSFVVADEASDRKSISSAAVEWARAFNSHDAAAFAALVTEDVLVLTGEAHRIDKPSLAAQSWLRAASLTHGEIKASDREIVITGDTAWRVGAIAYQRSNGSWHKGQTLEIWKRTPAGWKLHRQMSSHLLEHTLRPPPSEPVLDKPTN